MLLTLLECFILIYVSLSSVGARLSCWPRLRHAPELADTDKGARTHSQGTHSCSIIRMRHSNRLDTSWRSLSFAAATSLRRLANLSSPVSAGPSASSSPSAHNRAAVKASTFASSWQRRRKGKGSEMVPPVPSSSGKLSRQRWQSSPKEAVVRQFLDASTIIDTIFLGSSQVQAHQTHSHIFHLDVYFNFISTILVLLLTTGRRTN